MAYKIDKDKCLGCGACVEECPVGACAISDDDGKSAIDPEKCIECGACAGVCPVEAPKEG